MTPTNESPFVIPEGSVEKVSTSNDFVVPADAVAPVTPPPAEKEVPEDAKAFEQSVVQPAPKVVGDMPGTDIAAILKAQKPYKTLADFQTKDGLADVNAYNQYLASESKEQFTQRKSDSKATKEAEKKGYMDEVKKLERGDFDALDPDKLTGALETYGAKPSDATLTALKKFTDQQARSLPQRAKKLEALMLANEAAVSDLQKTKDQFPGLNDAVNQLNVLHTAYENEPDANKKNEIAKQFNALREGNAEALSQLQKREEAAKALFSQVTTMQKDMKSDIAQLQGLDKYYEDNNYWYDKNASFTDNLKSMVHSVNRAADLGFANVFKHADAISKIIAGATGLESSGAFGKIADKIQSNVAQRSEGRREPETVLTKVGEGLGGLAPMFAELALTPEYAIGKVVVPKFVTYMGYTSALNKFNERVDKMKEDGVDYTKIPFKEQAEVLKESGKAGAVGLGEGVILNSLMLGANRYGGSLPSRAALSGGAFAGYEAVKDKIQGHELNDKDLIASFIIGAGLQAQGELTGKSPTKATEEKLQAEKQQADVNFQDKLLNAWMEVTPQSKDALQKIVDMPESPEKTQLLKDYRENTLKEIPDKFKADLAESEDIKIEAAQELEEFKKTKPKGLDVWSRLINRYQLTKDVEGLKQFVQDAQTIEATPEEIAEIRKVMEDNWTDFAQAKGTTDKKVWNDKMQMMFGENATLLNVISKMNSRQRALLLNKMVNGEGGGEFKVPLTEKVMHYIAGKSLKDIYGFNYNKPDSNPGRAFWTSSRETIRNVLTNENLGAASEKAEDLRNEANSEPVEGPATPPPAQEGEVVPTPEEVRQQKRIAAQMIESVVAINKEASVIASSPDYYITLIKNDDSISPEDKEMFYKMVDDAVQNKGALGAKASQLTKELDDLQMELGSIGAPGLSGEAQKKVIEDKIEDKTKQLRELYAKFKTSSERADEIAEEEKKLAEQQAKEAEELAKQQEEEAKLKEEEEKKKLEEEAKAEEPDESQENSENGEEIAKNKIEVSESFAKIPISELTTDLEKFQGRKGAYSKQTFDRIVNEAKEGTLNISAIPPIQIWRNPEGEWVILGGHSRTAGFSALSSGEYPMNEKFTKADFERINAQIVEADTLEEAKKIAQESNQGAQQTDLENAARVKEMREGWKGGKGELSQKMKDLYGKNTNKLDKLSYLNPSGHAMHALGMFEETNEGDYKETATKFSAWTGEARKRFPNLTDAHENEIFDYLMQGKKDAFKKESDFLDLLNRRVNGLEVFKPEEPLNLQNRIGRGANELEYVKGIEELEKEQTRLRSEIRKVTESGIPRDEKNRKISELQKTVLDNEDKLTELGKLRKLAVEGDKQQISIFDQISEQMQQTFAPTQKKGKFKDIEGLDADLDEFMGAREEPELDMSPEKIGKGQKMIKKFLDNGITEFGDMVEYIHEKYGPTVAEQLFEPIKFVYGGMRLTANKDLKAKMTPLAELDDFTYDKFKDHVSSTNSNLESDRAGGNVEKPVGENEIPDESTAIGNADEAGRGELDERHVASADNSSTTTSTPVIVGTHGYTELFEQEQLKGIDADISESGEREASSGIDGEGYEDEQTGAGDVDESFDDRNEKELVAKKKEQDKAEKVSFERGRDNIEKSLPFLLPHQHENIEKAEKRFLDDKEKGFGIFDGTGTGKGLTSLGIAKRFLQRGKKNILIVAPSDKKVSDWVEEAAFLNIKARGLKDTRDGKDGGVLATTFANMRQNTAIEKVPWDLILYDEAHNLNSNETGTNTEAERKHRLISGAPEIVRKDIEDSYPLPKLPAGEYDTAARKVEEEAIKKLREEKYQEEIDKTKVVFLTATPFAWHKNLYYADGYLFHMGNKSGMEAGYNQGSSSDQFFMSNFGYRMRYNKLTRPESGVDVGLMERNFHESLKKTGAITASRPVPDKDYERAFLLVGDTDMGKLGAEMDRGLSLLYTEKKYEALRDVVRKKWNYLYTQRLLEAIKAKEVLPIIENAVDNGEKVVVFHKYNEGIPSHPFDFSDPVLYFGMKEGEQRKALEQWRQFADDHPELVDMDVRGLKNPIRTFVEAFADNVLLFNGNTPKKVRRNNVELFNDPNSRKDIIVVNLAAGEAGLNLHDKIGSKPRVTLQLGLPTRPTSAIQTEGRTDRYGMQSDAKFVYPVLHFNYEKWAFGDINNRSRTVENLAMGESARNLETSFKDGYINPVESYSEITGKGGRELDKNMEVMDEFEKAKTYYFSKQKKTSKNKSFEGIDYFATPEPLGYKMVQWVDAKPNDALLEPSAGHGAIGRFFPGDTKNKFIEPSRELNASLSVVSGGDVINERFEDHHIVNKYEGIVMNPPFGFAGKTAIDHLSKAFDHLKEGGRIVGIFPVGAFDTKFDKWVAEKYPTGKLIRLPNVKVVSRFLLPSVTFERAGTQVNCQVLVIDKVPNMEDGEWTGGLRTPFGSSGIEDIDLRQIDSIKDFFDTIKSINVPPRPVMEGTTEPKQNTDEFKDVENPIAELDKFNHSKTGAPLSVVKLTSYVGPGKFAEYKAMSKELGGYWSSFKGQGAIPGFIFQSEEPAIKLRNQILEDQKKETPNPKEQTELFRKEEQPIVSPELKQHIQDKHVEVAYGEGAQLSAIEQAKVAEIKFTDGTTLRQSNLIKDFREQNRIVVGDYTFKPETLPLDAANLFSQVRSPLIEKMGIMYYGYDGKVMNAELHTLGLPSQTGFGTTEGSARAAITRIINEAVRMGAKGFVIAHNHPSGNHKPSFSDTIFTRDVARLVKNANEMDFPVEFGGHVITDSNKFTFLEPRDSGIDENDYSYEGKDFQFKDYPQLTLRRNGGDPVEKMLEYAKQIVEGGYDKVVVFLSTKYGLRGYDIMPDNLSDIQSKVKQRMNDLGATRYILVSTKSPNLPWAEMPGGMMDYIQVEGKNATSFDISTPAEEVAEYQRFHEETPQYNEQLPDDLKQQTISNLETLAKELNKSKGLTGEDLADALKTHLEELGIGHIAHLVDEIDLPGAVAKEMPSRKGDYASTDEGKPQGAGTGEPFNLAEKVKEIFAKYNVPINEGSLRKRYAGVYKYFTQGVRVQSMWNLFVAAHEMTHALDAKHGTSEAISTNRAANKELVKQLKDAYENLYPSPKKSAKLKEKIMEGFAMSVQYYLADRAYFVANYPLIVNELLHPSGKYYQEELSNFMNDMEKVVNEYHSLAPQDKVGARIKWMGTDREHGLGFFKKLQLNFFNDLQTATDIDEMMGGKYRAKAISPNAVMFRNTASIASNWLTHPFGVAAKPQTYKGFGNWGDTRSGKRVMDYLNELKDPTSMVEFNELLIARRQHEDYLKLDELADRIKAETTGDAAIDAGNDVLQGLIEERNRLEGIVENNELPRDVAEGTVTALEGTYGPQLAIYDAINGDLLDFMQSTGLLSADKADEYRSRKGYASYQRFMEDEYLSEINNLSVSSATKGRLKSLYARKGSSRQYLPPVYSQMLAINEAIRKGTYNLTLQSWANAAQNNIAVGRLFEAVQKPEAKKSSTDFVKVMMDGKEQWYKTSPEFREFAEALSPGQVDMMSAFMRGASRVFRTGTTVAYPLFALVNLPVDAVTRFAFTKTGLIPGLHDMRSLGQMAQGFMDWLGLISKETEFQKYISQGASQAMDFRQQSLEPQGSIDFMLNKGAKRKALHIVELGLDVLSLPSNLSEYMGRGAEYIRAIKQGHPSNVAMLMASEVSLNFGQRGKMGGKMGSEYVRWVAYMNVGFQALGQTMSQMKDNPARVSAAFGLIMTLGLSTALLTYLLGSDDEKDELADQQPSELARWIYIPNSVLGIEKAGFVKMRIPENFGAPMGMAQLYLAHHYKNKPNMFKEYLQAAETELPQQLRPTQGIMGNLAAALPTAISPSLQIATNTKFYPQMMPLVPQGLSDKLAKDQYTKYSSETAKLVGKTFDMSPIAIDFFIRNQFGRSTSLVQSIAESMVTDNGVKTYIPMFQEYDRFLFSGRMYNRFWNMKETADKTYNSLKSDPNASVEMKAQAELEKKNYEVTAEMLRKVQDHVNSGKDLTDQQKRDLFDHLNGITSSDDLLTNNVPASLKTFDGTKVALTETEKAIQDKADIAKQKKELVRQERERMFGKLTPEDSYMSGKDGDEKVDYYANKFEKLSQSEAMTKIEELINKGVITPTARDKSKVAIRIMERLQKN